ncbi:hypothetical protein JTB14_024687 [Gonioctena quinquepunctata]|nr:hypothetical protein JTB14_024687 [Gonioctena quinquepunctata]
MSEITCKLLVFIILGLLCGNSDGKRDSKRERMEEVKKLVKKWSSDIGERLLNLSKKMTKDEKVEEVRCFY